MFSKVFALLVVGVLFTFTFATAQDGDDKNEPGYTPIEHNDDWDPVIEEFDGIAMVLVPTGCFMMGSTDEEIVALNEERGGADAFEDEGPQHKICFEEPFWIMQTEVTNAQYQRCVEDGVCTESLDDSLANAEHPVAGVDWAQANDFAMWWGGSLPTEAQWEYAARGPDGLKYPWGDGEPTCDRANIVYRSNYCVGRTTPVGSYTSGTSWVGALDMTGNVWEWVADWYSADYYEILADGAYNPLGPKSGTWRVTRGGSAWGDSDFTRAASRGKASPLYYDRSLGFRVVRALSQCYQAVP